VGRKEADGDVVSALLHSDSFDELSVAAVDHSDANYFVRLINNYAVRRRAPAAVQFCHVFDGPSSITDRAMGVETTFCAIQSRPCSM